MKRTLKKVLRFFGYEIHRNKSVSAEKPADAPVGSVAQEQAPLYPADFSDFTREVIARVKPYTMTSPERIASLVNACEYVIKNKVQGDFVECGVWRGGSALVMITVLQKYGIADRRIHLFDTFEGMSEPTGEDISIEGESAVQLLEAKERDEEDHVWAYSPLDKVREVLESTGYPKENILYYKGKVEDTLPVDRLSCISILRLDTDWYESTRHELIHLYPLLTQSGVPIIDDYGHWQGARKAVDEYFADKKILLNRIDYTGRIAVKP